MYATHSPYFIDPRFFDQVRRVTRRQHAPDEHPSVSVHLASLDAVTKRLNGSEVTDDALRSRWDQVWTKNLAEAFFADAVVLVEGDTDKGILDGIAARKGQTALEVEGITVAYSGGKQHLFIPHAILAELSIRRSSCSITTRAAVRGYGPTASQSTMPLQPRRMRSARTDGYSRTWERPS